MPHACLTALRQFIRTRRTRWAFARLRVLQLKFRLASGARQRLCAHNCVSRISAPEESLVTECDRCGRVFLIRSA
jgi:hypothetical protein